MELRLEGTHMSSEIPASIKNLVNLEILEINDADVTGTLPSELGELTMLSKLFLGGNLDLQGGIPSVVGMLSALGKCCVSMAWSAKKNGERLTHCSLRNARPAI